MKNLIGKISINNESFKVTKEDSRFVAYFTEEGEDHVYAVSPYGEQSESLFAFKKWIEFMISVQWNPCK